jgi:putative tryptophan/tyrosine transport system substrate-binding protein
MPVIGYLSTASDADSIKSVTLGPFLQGLKETGFVESENISIEYRFADGHNDRMPAVAADLVNRHVAVICAIGGRLPAISAKAATATIPIVFSFGGDPVRQGLVTSLSRPGGNATGAVNLTGGETDAKAVEFLRELAPAAASLGLLVNPTNLPPGGIQAQEAARILRWKSQIFDASTDDDLKTAFETIAKQKVGAANVVPDPFFTNRRAQIVALAAQYAIPTSYYARDFVIAGGLMSYGPDFREASHVAGNYVGRILKGEKPADLPVQQAVKVEMVINLKTAKTLGLTVPQSILVRADQVIE